MQVNRVPPFSTTGSEEVHSAADVAATSVDSKVARTSRRYDDGSPAGGDGNLAPK